MTTWSFRVKMEGSKEMIFKENFRVDGLDGVLVQKRRSVAFEKKEFEYRVKSKQTEVFLKLHSVGMLMQDFQNKI